jgi:CheY-like chemotaxis protein
VKNIFFIHWESTEIEALAAQITQMGYSVATECKDSPTACRRVTELLPDAVVISLRRFVSGGRETGRFLGTSRVTKHIPLIYMDGPRDARRDRIREILPEAIFSSIQDLPETLARVLGNAPAGNEPPRE